MQPVGRDAEPFPLEHLHDGVMVVVWASSDDVNRVHETRLVEESLHELETMLYRLVAVENGIVYVVDNCSACPSLFLHLQPRECLLRQILPLFRFSFSPNEITLEGDRRILCYSNLGP